MSWTVLSRTVMIVAECWAYNVALTPPNPPPPKEEVKKHTDTMPLSVYWMAKIWKGLFYSTALIEVVAVAATHLPLDEYATQLHLAPLVPVMKHLRGLIGASNLNLFISPESVVGCGLAVGGALLRMWCYRTLAKAFTFELSVKDGHKLVQSGPYAYVRHPSYTGYYALMIGAAMLTYGRGSWWGQVGFSFGVWRCLAMAHVGWQVLLMSSFWGRCDLEDQVLKEHFKGEWVKWAKNVPYRLIPGVL
ncbi:hypothetical protein BDW22DRAFT_1364051 [Trametopsis cervina]|nr:hypothetical protein BDW22DRAFT_1364051 [Trametopsis cervina]